jgi:hypothetical protein
VRSRTRKWPSGSWPRGLLEHVAKVPRLFDDLLTGVAELSEEDIGLIATALE